MTRSSAAYRNVMRDGAIRHHMYAALTGGPGSAIGNLLWVESAIGRRASARESHQVDAQ